MDFQRKEPSFLARRIDEKYKMKESVTGHRTGLTDRLLKLFAPRKPLEFWAPETKKPKAVPMSGIAGYVDRFAAAGEPEYGDPSLASAEPRPFQSPELQLQARIETETAPERRVPAAAARDVSADPNVEGDPFKTLFVGRLAYETTERKLRREFEEFGPIRRIRMVQDRTSGKPRGYAFIEYEQVGDMKQAYKLADGRKIEGRRILVDVERGRAVPGWLPRYMGGGKGGESRATKPPKDPKRVFAQRQIDRFLEEQAARRRGAAAGEGGEEAAEERGAA
ncbi:hypothetical protein QBZ16_004372 [Prototheca wickerhamii]|uniref:U1 small nuclear ribonucleoprotein 70 kDa n=1 Tax=Prototheca wickerhamii TaxID=3111 RepID=A0AAD9IJW2_PROWI|nr:hypothetical protein QBZ16_004372 [Prototheca wickerhamii]